MFNVGVLSSVIPAPVFTYSYFNPADKKASAVLSDSNKVVSSAASVASQANSVTSKSSGKYRVQFVIQTYAATVGVGFTSAAASAGGTFLGNINTGYALWGNYTGTLRSYTNNTPVTYSGFTYANGTVVDLFISLDTGKAWFRVDGTLIGTAPDPTTDTNPVFSFATATPYLIAADPFGAGGNIRLRTDPAEMVYSPISGFTDGWPD